MLRSGIWLFSLLLFIVPVPLASAQDAGPPKTIAFVVGVQHYDDPDLNKLQYTVKDAQDVFERLEAVTDLDLERSRLLLADPNSADEADPNDPEWVIRKSKLGLQEIQDELANLLEIVRNDETVVFYFGGHGTVQEQHLLFLPSDYSRKPQKRFWRYSNIIDDIRGRINARRLRDVSVVFFANMCGAGTAAGDMSAEQDLDGEFVKEWLSNHTLGFKRFALFPASAPNQNTFEHPEFKRSVFAHHLVEGLRGGAATDGVITAESLFSYLDAKIQDDLPKDPNAFDPTIRIGVTRELEGHALYLNGLSLLSDALDTDDPLFWRLAQRNLQEAATFSGVGRVGTLAALRLAQLRAVQGGDLTELSGILAPVTGPAATDTGLRAAAASLLEATKKRAASQRFVAVIVSSSYSDYGSVELWKDFLQGFPGNLSVDEILISESANEEVGKVDVVTKLNELRTKYGGRGDTPHLIFVYAGDSFIDESDNTISLPFEVGVYRELIELWEGEFTLIYDTQFGGPLKKAFEEGLFGDITLVLAAEEVNGMTFETHGTELVIELLKSNAIDLTNWAPLATYRAELTVALGPASPWVVGTPYVSRSQRSPSPVFADATGAMRETSAILSPVRRLASLIATGCDPGCAQFASGPVETTIENDGVIGAIGKVATLGSTETEPLYDLLKKATLFDFGGHVERAYASYGQFLELFEQVHKTAGDLPAAESQLRESARNSLDRMIRQVHNRVDGLQGKLTREVHLLLAGVQEYRSPLVPDVADAQGDLGAWKAILDASGIWGRASAAGAGSVPVNLNLIDTSSRRKLLETLGDALTKVADDDLVLFVFSGRGIELEGERYLAPADVGMKAEASYSPPVNPQHAIAAKASSDMSQPLTEELVSIAEIAELARGRWFVGIYDAQFTEPVFEAGRADSLLDKHLNSVRPSPSETAATSPELKRFLEGDKDFPGTHVHIWGEGRLTERLSAPAGCEADPVRKVRSPMTAALLATLQEDSYGTYGDWILRAQEHPCLAANFTFIVQGAHDLPRFASGNAATQIPYFLSGRERRDTNLDVADGITAIASQSGDHPLFSLSRAAVLVALTEFDSAAPPREEQVPADRLNEALDLLRELHGSQRVRDSDLEAEVLDLFTRALMLSGDVDQARNRLLQAPSDQLMSDTLQMRLLELTERELRQSPTAILRETEKKLAELDASPNTTARLKMLSSSYEAPRGQYRIVTSTGPSP